MRFSFLFGAPSFNLLLKFAVAKSIIVLMKQSKLNIALGFLLLALSALFFVALLLQPLDYGHYARVAQNPLFTLGAMLATVYGASSVIIPGFLFMAALTSFNSAWSMRQAFRLLSAVVPFFTCVFCEKFIKATLANPLEDFVTLKVAVIAAGGALLCIIELLVASKLGDLLAKKSVKKEEWEDSEESHKAIVVDEETLAREEEAAENFDEAPVKESEEAANEPFAIDGEDKESDDEKSTTVSSDSLKVFENIFSSKPILKKETEEGAVEPAQSVSAISDEERKTIERDIAKIKQGEGENAQSITKTTQTGSETAQDAVKATQVGGETAQDAVKATQVGAKSAQDAVKVAQVGAENAHVAANATQRGGESTQDVATQSFVSSESGEGEEAPEVSHEVALGEELENPMSVITEEEYASLMTPDLLDWPDEATIEKAATGRSTGGFASSAPQTATANDGASVNNKVRVADSETVAQEYNGATVDSKVRATDGATIAQGGEGAIIDNEANTKPSDGAVIDNKSDKRLSKTLLNKNDGKGNVAEGALRTNQNNISPEVQEVVEESVEDEWGQGAIDEIDDIEGENEGGTEGGCKTFLPNGQVISGGHAGERISRTYQDASGVALGGSDQTANFASMNMAKSVGANGASTGATEGGDEGFLPDNEVADETITRGGQNQNSPNLSYGAVDENGEEAIAGNEVADETIANDAKSQNPPNSSDEMVDENSEEAIADNEVGNESVANDEKNGDTRVAGDEVGDKTIANDAKSQNFPNLIDEVAEGGDDVFLQGIQTDELTQNEVTKSDRASAAGDETFDGGDGEKGASDKIALGDSTMLSAREDDFDGEGKESEKPIGSVVVNEDFDETVAKDGGSDDEEDKKKASKAPYKVGEVTPFKVEEKRGKENKGATIVNDLSAPKVSEDFDINDEFFDIDLNTVDIDEDELLRELEKDNLIPAKDESEGSEKNDFERVTDIDNGYEGGSDGEEEVNDSEDESFVSINESDAGEGSEDSKSFGAHGEAYEENGGAKFIESGETDLSGEPSGRSEVVTSEDNGASVVASGEAFGKGNANEASDGEDLDVSENLRDAGEREGVGVGEASLKNLGEVSGNFQESKTDFLDAQCIAANDLTGGSYPNEGEEGFEGDGVSSEDCDGDDSGKNLLDETDGANIDSNTLNGASVDAKDEASDANNYSDVENNENGSVNDYSVGASGENDSVNNYGIDASGENIGAVRDLTSDGEEGGAVFFGGSKVFDDMEREISEELDREVDIDDENMGEGIPIQKIDPNAINSDEEDLNIENRNLTSEKEGKGNEGTYDEGDAMGEENARSFIAGDVVGDESVANAGSGEAVSEGGVASFGSGNSVSDEDVVSLSDGETMGEESAESLGEGEGGQGVLAENGGATSPAPRGGLIARVTAMQSEKVLNSESVSGAMKPYFIPTDILEETANDQYWVIDDDTKRDAELLKDTLNQFNIKGDIVGIKKGPVVTMFELSPAPGVKLSKIVTLQDNIALNLAASSVRIVAPIPGRAAVGIEVPNKHRSIVGFRELIEQDLSEYTKMAIPIVLGKDILGRAQLFDLVKTPHLLIAGATGAGKSVCVNTMILSILYKRSPDKVKLILIDPKVVELKLYNDIPHLLTPVITDAKHALQSLQYCLCEMERRYSMLDKMGVRDISSYNKRITERKLAMEKLPYIVVIIDEFADLMATTGKELEGTIARLCAMSRAVGIHLVLATQRPSIDVITGLIKANIPTRIAFMVASKTDSRIIIDQVGAEMLLGKGDMLYASAVDPFPVRIQGTFVSDTDVEKVVEAVKSYGEPEYIDDEIFIDDEDGGGSDDSFAEGPDPLYEDAVNIVTQAGKASASYIQRRLKIGYNRAARLVEDMEARGIVGPANGSKPRQLVRGAA